MKSLRKIMALLIAMVMVLGMSVSVFASTISVDTTKDSSTHTYKVYQIFTGTPGENNELTNVQYGSSYPGGLTGAVPSATLKAITDARAWAAANKGKLGNPVATIDGEHPDYQNAVPGWYLILDTAYTQSADNKDAYSAFMMKVVNGNATFKPKKEVPSVDKQVEDNDDSVASGDNDGFGETADHEIGQSFKFKLTATIPAGDYTAYNTYKVIFNDTMSKGITFESIESIKIDGTVATGTVAGIQAGDKGAKTWTITFDNVTQVAGHELQKDLAIEVIYKAHLNDEAVISTANGSTDNKNTVSLTYSNNPDATGEGDTDTTPEDTVWVFTYGNTGTKVDANNQPVAGAGFVLYKIDATKAATIGDSTDVPEGTVVPLYKNDEGYFVYDETNAAAYTGGDTVTDNEIITTDNGGNVFAIKGLDVGTYALYEKTVPTGYVQAKNTIVTITATHAEDANSVGQVDLGSSTVTETITNYTGSTLPSTGGMGTTLFYIVGGILVAGAAIILIAKRKVNA